MKAHSPLEMTAAAAVAAAATAESKNWKASEASPNRSEWEAKKKTSTTLT